MNRVPIADFAATVPWDGITGKPSNIGGVSDLSQMGWANVAAGYPYWNGSRFIRTTISIPSAGTVFRPDALPGQAVRRRIPGLPDGEFENVFARYAANVREYGAVGDGGSGDSGAFNKAIYDINAAGGGTLYIPAGAYFLDLALDLIEVPCLVYGDGVGVARILCNNGDGFSFFGANRFTLAALSLEDAVTAVECEGGELYIHEVGVETSYRGIDLINVTGGHISAFYGISAGTAAVGIYGSANALQCSGIGLLGAGSQWAHGVYLTAGTANIVNGLYANGVAGNAVYLGTAVGYSRITNVTAKSVLGSSVVEDLGTANYVNEIYGIGGNTDTRYDARKELFQKFTWAPGGIQPGFGFYDNFTLAGASLGDQMVLGCPINLAPSVFTDVRATGPDSALITILNAGTSAIYIGTSVWAIRAFN